MIILASTSPTRAKLLTDFGISFIQKPIFFDEESVKQTAPLAFIYHATLGKADDAKQRYGLDTPILCADTVVTSKGEILRKAKNSDDARHILAKQSGNSVKIVTCTILLKKTLTFIDISETVYRFLPFDSEDIERYIASGEWEGKAGACMVEGFCKTYIAEVQGFQSCAMGLTVEKVLPFLDNICV